ncbi:MAG: ATP-binding protein [Candidatus Caldatribacteriota bacterium]
MSFSLTHLILISISYLITLFAVAWMTERGWVPRRLVRHPITYTLSIGVYASSWAFYGAVGLAYRYGNGFLSIYLGLSGAFLLAPVLLYPIQQLTRTHQLSSLADLFAFRFRSSTAGAVTALGLLIGSLPLLALQIQAVAETVSIMTGKAILNEIALFYCVLIALFSILFGARHSGSREKHEGLVFAIAFESLVKLIAILCVGGYALWYIFSGPSDLENWLLDNKQFLNYMQVPLQEGPWRTLLLLFFSSAIVMPHLYHMVFTENLNPRAMMTASWGLPLFLLLMSLPVPIILWAGLKLEVASIADYFTLGLGITVNNPNLALIAFMGGLSAASGVTIVLTIALSGMVLNHLILPLYPPSAENNIYRWLKWSRRLLIFAIIAAAYTLYIVLSSNPDLSSLGIIAFAGTLQFFPGVLATLYWPKANRYGFISGVTAGLLIWGVGLLLPLLSNVRHLVVPGLNLNYQLDPNSWHNYSILALSVNCSIFVVVSLITRTSKEEKRSAQASAINKVIMPERRTLQAGSAQDFALALAKPLGAMTAQREVDHALQELGLPFDESRPFALRRLRNQIKANLSGLMGPSIAQDLVSSFLPYTNDSESYQTEDIHFIESRLEDYRSRLTGLAAELDALRRYHRQTLQDLPLGVCSLSADHEILMWNRAMEALTGIAAVRVIGSRIQNIDQPWQELLTDFVQGSDNHFYKKKLQSQYESRWLNLHKAAIDQLVSSGAGGLVLLIEDTTQTRLLEDKLMHAERLASIGRLAAGVAHEIGNPITGIACLAQIVREERTEDAELLEISEQIIEQTKRVTRIVQSMMNFARSEHQIREQFVPVQLYDVCNEAINLLRLNQQQKPVDFINQIDPHFFVLGDAQRLGQVFINLLDNARDASPAESSIRISSRASSTEVWLYIEDQGTGIDAAFIEQLFEPFFTTKDPGQGTGLGLAMVFSIIEEHQGDISIDSPCDKVNQRGTRFCIRLPRHTPTKTNVPALIEQ